MVLLVLAVIWLVALTPLVLRKMSERQVTTSVDSFRRQLRGLRRAYPRLAATAATAAHPDMALSMARMAHGGPRTTMAVASATAGSGAYRGSDASGGSGASGRSSASRGSGTSGGSGTSVGSGGRRRPDDDRDELNSPGMRRGAHPSGTAGNRPSSQRGSALRPSPQAARRRQVLMLLAGTTIGSFVLGAIPGLSVLWDLSLLALAATAAYVALLIYFHRLAVEREIKVVELRDRRPVARVAMPVTPFDPYVPDRRGEPEPVEDELEYLDDLDDYDYDEMAAGGR